MGRRARRELIAAAFDEFHTAMGGVLGAADQLRDRTTRRHAATMSELWLREQGLDAARADPGMQVVLANPRLADVVARVTADRDAAFDAWQRPDPPAASGPDRLAALMAEHAPGRAGAVDGWQGDPVVTGAARAVPQLWRIGTGVVGTGRTAGGPGTFPVGLPLLDESHLQINATHETRIVAESLVEALLLRVVGYFRPGLVQLHVWDVGQFTGSLPGLYPLTRTGLLTVHDPGNLEGLLEEMSNRIRRVHTRVLVEGDPSLKALAERGAPRTEPWVVTVLVGNRNALREEDQRQLQRVLRGGLACGISLVLLDVPLTIGAPLETVRLLPVDGDPDAGVVATTSMTGPFVAVTPDPPLPGEAVTRACRAIADEHERLRTRVGAFRDLMLEEDERGRGDSRTGLHAPIGFVDGRPSEIVLADASPHALIGGPSGSGKTNLLLTMIASLAVRYSPRELELHLLDFKEGVSFAQFAPGRSGGTWLPQARLIGVNINTDREFGLALLVYLADEMRRRAAAAKSYEVTKLEELREVDEETSWPRIVAVIDEFQYLFAERDAVTRQATQLLEDVARRGRSQGIHLVLASQDVASIEAFWGRPAIFEQFVLRIALPRARRVLSKLNEAALHLPRWHAVVNHESGIEHGNETVRIPDATGKLAVDDVQRWLYKRYVEGSDSPPDEPRLFDGSRAPEVAALLPNARADVPQALVGQCIDFAGSAATVALPPAPGRNVAVLGPDSADAERVLAAAAISLATHHVERPDAGAVRFVLAPLVATAVAAATALRPRLAAHTVDVVRLDGFRDLLEKLADEVVRRLSSGERTPIYLVLYAGDAADAVLDRDGTNWLRQVLRFGPETGVHAVGWWRSPQRLKSLLSLTASADDVGAFVALDVQGAELASLAPPGMLPVWSPRPGRALMFDRVRHSEPVVVIVPAAEGEAR